MNQPVSTLSTLSPPEELPAAEEYTPYRALSRSAVASLILGLFSLLAFIAPPLLIFAFFGLLLGINAVLGIRRYPEELSGRSLAWAGSLVSAVALFGGGGLHTYVYATEVPEGYQRVSFAELQPLKEQPQEPVPPTALALDGKKVFVKGYVYPDGQQYNIKRFVLVPDMGTCCFGGQPKLTDMIEVTLKDPHRTEYSRRKRKLAGTLKVDRALKPVDGLGGVYYQLEAEYVQ